MGLSGSVFTSVYMGAFKPHMLHFLLFLAIGPPVIGAFTLAFVNLVPPHSRPLRPSLQGGRASVTGVLKQAAGGAPCCMLHWRLAYRICCLPVADSAAPHLTIRHCSCSSGRASAF